MDIQWINEQYKEGNRIFDSMWEVEEWVDGLYSDFGGCLRVDVGYATLDEKVFSCLSKNLPEWAKYNNAPVVIHTATEHVDERPVYKIWVTSSG